MIIKDDFPFTHVEREGFKLSFIQFAIDKLYPEKMCMEILQCVKATLYKLFEFYAASWSILSTAQAWNDVQPTMEENCSCGQ